MIPRRFHWIWFGPAPMPADYLRFIGAWLEMNPGWEGRVWSSFDQPLINQDIFDLIRIRGANPGVTMRADQAVAVQQADVAAYEIIYRHGGVVLNCDMEPLKPIGPILADVDAFAGYEDDDWLVNAVMGCAPGHPFFKAVIDELPRRYRALPGHAMSVQTGPQLLTHVAATHPTGLSLARFPREVFHGVHHSQVEIGGDASGIEAPGDAVARHHWGHRRRAAEVV